jgi:hypothetical protein
MFLNGHPLTGHSCIPQGASPYRFGENVMKPTQREVEQILTLWTGKPLEDARLIIQKYGLPDGATPEMLVWYNNTP